VGKKTRPVVEKYHCEVMGAPPYSLINQVGLHNFGGGRE